MWHFIAAKFTAARIVSPKPIAPRASAPRLTAALCLLLAGLLVSPTPATANPKTFTAVRPKMVKIYGAGGFRGLESYQSGFLISAEGHVLTVWSYVLDTEFITVVTDDGRRFEEVQLLGADPRLELAVLKLDAEDLPHFDLDQAAQGKSGTRVLAFSNLYGVASGNEPVSMQHGVVSIRTRLQARRGVFQTRYRGDAYVVDAVTNNPGAAGGALTNRKGELLGMLGKELRNTLNNTWLNYAVPVDQMRKTIDEILSGIHVPANLDELEGEKPPFPLSLPLLGITMVPDVLERTPTFIDYIRPGSSAAAAGLKPDDLVLFLNGQLVQSCKILAGELEKIDQAEKVVVTVIRGDELLDVELSAAPPAKSPD
ncbi:MAG: S1C family serine protease [Planctomycetales bacterium]